MSSRAELDRRLIKKSGSPLARHSLNQKQMHDQRQGVIRVFGKKAESFIASLRRDDVKKQRQQVLYESINNIFQGKPAEEDILNYIMLSDEFEKIDPEVPNATIIDFKRMQSSNACFKVPEIIRKDKK